ELNSERMIKAANGKRMKLLKVFTESLRFLKDDALNTINSQINGIQFDASDFIWVLTVPVIWSHLARQFMREAATKAGIITEETGDKLVIALEPEAASVWCKKLPSDDFIVKDDIRKPLEETAGTRYIVVDCGGGTVDFTVHEVLESRALKELYKASGNNLGGQSVDRKFRKFLREIFCDGVWDAYERDYPSELQQMMYDFAIHKQKNQDAEITCPPNLKEMANKNIGRFFKSVEGASFDGDYIKISRDKLRSFFDESLKGISESLREIFKTGLHTGFVLLVGGYAQSQILQDHIIDQFGDQCKVLCPIRAQETILRGAVEVGRNPEVVYSRKSSFTYGFAVCERFLESKHNEKKKFIVNGRAWSKDIFKKLVEKDEDIRWDETRQHLCIPARANQVEMKLKFYSSLKNNPLYVDEEGAEEVGLLSVDVGKGGKVKTEIKFQTEIRATGTNLITGQKKEIKITFMTKDQECVIEGDTEETSESKCVIDGPVLGEVLDGADRST
ncbi:hypothetical protein GOODEAATRI_022640, partial [Goodea atripinnis]